MDGVRVGGQVGVVENVYVAGESDGHECGERRLRARACGKRVPRNVNDLRTAETVDRPSRKSSNS